MLSLGLEIKKKMEYLKKQFNKKTSLLRRLGICELKFNISLRLK